MRLTHGSALAGALLAAVIAATAVGAIINRMPKTHQAADPYQQDAQLAHVLGISLWSSHEPNPHERQHKVDVLSVTLQNPSGSSKEYAYFDLVSTNKPNENQNEPTVLMSSAQYEVNSVGDYWVARLSPGQMTRILFVAQSSRYKKYCALGGKLQQGVLRRVCTT